MGLSSRMALPFSTFRATLYLIIGCSKNALQEGKTRNFIGGFIGDYYD